MSYYDNSNNAQCNILYTIYNRRSRHKADDDGIVRCYIVTRESLNFVDRFSIFFAYSKFSNSYSIITHENHAHVCLILVIFGPTGLNDKNKIIISFRPVEQWYYQLNLDVAPVHNFERNFTLRNFYVFFCTKCLLCYEKIIFIQYLSRCEFKNNL